MRTISAAIFWGSVFLIVSALSACSTAADKATTSIPSTNLSQKGTKPEVRKVQSQSSLEALRQGAAPATPKESPLQEIYFDFDKYDLQLDARNTLHANAEWLKNNPAVLVDIEGHCDERGTTEYNLALGAKRAQAAKDYLASLGISASRLSTTSYGKETPVCREHTEECWQRNRRDRFVARSQKPGV
jgi:peptidoglycan-associated lipoprotein